MRIERVEAIPVRVPRVKPMVAAGLASPLAVSDFGIVRVHTDEGVTGLGEISMNGGDNGARQCRHVVEALAPTLVGGEATGVRAALRRMDEVLPGAEPAKAGVEMALWDIAGKALGVPLHELLGGRVRDAVPVRWGLAFGPPGPGVEEALAHVERGFGTIKVKIGRPGTGLDREMVAAVRAAVGDEVQVMVDANSAYVTPLQALQELRPLEAYGLQLVEQPLPRTRLRDLALLRSRLDTPVLLDESMRHWHDAYRIAEAGAADALSVYLCESGGVLPALAACAIGEAAGLPATLGSQCELGIGTAAMAHVAVCVPSLAYASDITGHLRYHEDVIVERLDYTGGAVRPPDGPGLGVTLDEERLERFRIDR